MTVLEHQNASHFANLVVFSDWHHRDEPIVMAVDKTIKLLKPDRKFHIVFTCRVLPIQWEKSVSSVPIPTAIVSSDSERFWMYLPLCLHIEDKWLKQLANIVKAICKKWVWCRSTTLITVLGEKEVTSLYD